MRLRLYVRFLVIQQLLVHVREVREVGSRHGGAEDGVVRLLVGFLIHRFLQRVSAILLSLRTAEIRLQGRRAATPSSPPH